MLVALRPEKVAARAKYIIIWDGLHVPKTNTTYCCVHLPSTGTLLTVARAESIDAAVAIRF